MTRRTLHTYGEPIGVAWRCGCRRVLVGSICLSCGWVDPRLAPKQEGEGAAPKRACTERRPHP